jgi:hypothetical protein
MAAFAARMRLSISALIQGVCASKPADTPFWNSYFAFRHV